jgi:hypothetical protein
MRPAAVLGFLLALSLGQGCGDHRREAIRLTRISPHRDEIREEVALAVKVWFRKTCETCAAKASASVLRWLDDETDDRFAAARQDLAQYQRLWRADDLEPLHQIIETWKAEPTTQHGHRLRDAIDQWREHPPQVELVWVDMGGTSQIARYLGSSFENKPDGIGIDVLFGGGSDIFIRFAEQGLLQKLDVASGLADHIPAQLRVSAGDMALSVTSLPQAATRLKTGDAVALFAAPEQVVVLTDDPPGAPDPPARP